MQTDDRPPLHERLNVAANVFLFVCSAVSLPAVLVLHRNLGSRYVGSRILLTALLMSFAPACFPHADPRPEIWFAGGVLIASVISRLGSWRRGSRHRQVHRYYDGTPRLLRVLPWISESTLKRIEPGIVMLAAVALMPLSEVVGGFLLFSAFGMYLSTAALEVVVGERVEVMLDQEIEQRNLIERYRHLRGK